MKTAEAQCSSNTTGAETVAGPVDDDATPESTVEVAGVEVPLFAGMIVVGFVVGSLLGLCIGVCAGRACGGGGNERNTQVAIPRDVSSRIQAAADVGGLGRKPLFPPPLFPRPRNSFKQDPPFGGPDRSAPKRE